MKKAAWAICVLFLFVSTMQADSLQQVLGFLDQSSLSSVRTGNIYILDETNTFSLFDKLGSTKLKQTAVLDTGTAGKMEALVYLPGKKKSLQDYYEKMHDITSLKGLEYYSVSSKKIKTLIRDAYCIGKPNQKNKIPDPLPDPKIPSQFDMYQDDSSFGGNFYKASALYENKKASMIIKNTSDMGLLFMTVFKPGNFQSYFSLLELDEGYLLYTAFFYKTEFSFGMKARIEESLSNRLKAFASWISN